MDYGPVKLQKKRGEDSNIEIKPVMSWKTKIIQIKELKKGDSIGYDRTYICDKDIIEQYVNLAKSIRGSKSLHVVIPDNPFCQDLALETVKIFKHEIKYLAKKCSVIIPFHNPVQRSVAEQARLVMRELCTAEIVLGIPCRRVKGNDWRMSIANIESILMLKTEEGGALFSKVHYLALSERTRGSVYEERLSLAQMYGLTMSADACRTTALFAGFRVGICTG